MATGSQAQSVARAALDVSGAWPSRGKAELNASSSVEPADASASVVSPGFNDEHQT
jgi:hypothetical protein